MARFRDTLLRLLGSSSGETILKAAAAASGTITLPAGTTDFSATGGTSQVVKQTSAGGAFTVAQLGNGDLSDYTGWTSDTPTVTAQTGTFTTVSGTNLWIKVGNIVLVEATVAITTNGTASGAVLITLPTAPGAPAGNAAAYGRAVSVSGKMLQGALVSGPARMSITNYDNTYPGANGENFVLSYFYRV